MVLSLSLFLSLSPPSSPPKINFFLKFQIQAVQLYTIPWNHLGSFKIPDF